jgi:hypothetical protein
MNQVEKPAKARESIGQPDKAPWMRPELHKLNAQAAEQGGVVATDLGVNFS